MKRTVAVVVLMVLLANCAPKLLAREYHQYERGHAIIISERVGEKVDVEERVHFGLFRGIDDFESAGFYDVDGGGYEVVIKTTKRTFVAVNRDPNAVEILRDYIDGYEMDISSWKAFEKKWGIVDYDEIGFAITTSEVRQHSNPIASTACAVGCAASIVGASFLAALAITDPGDLRPTTEEEELQAYIALGLGIFGGGVVGIFVHNWRNTINMEKALEFIKEARKLRPHTD